ncbi:MAG: hypothetical protein HUJ67_07525 [Ruminiclostridium sp.]|nr:hypothetical protein [Ruminiclostridium sp.]
MKANPAVQEIRAMFRDYCSVVQIQEELCGDGTGHENDRKVDELRARLKIAK